MLIPSQRRISFKNIELDMIIPNITELKKNSDDVILIFFAKTSNIDEIKQYIQEIKKLQSSDANIWVISKDNIHIPQITYTIKKESYSKFLKDTQTFVKTKNMNRLNIFKTNV
jgi:sulfatase maturation enzyme AslB (radical SAM superfamily)